MAKEPTELRESELSEEGERRRRNERTVVEDVLDMKPKVLEEPRRKANRKIRNFLR